VRSSGRLHSTARPLRNDVGNTAGQGRPASANDYGSWRLFLINKTMGAIRQLSPALAGEAQSLGNPTVSFVTLPPPTPGVAGAPALVFTCFIFGANNGATRTGGTHLRLSSPVTEKNLCVSYPTYRVGAGRYSRSGNTEERPYAIQAEICR
jgi:hypothetical protein